MPQQNTDKKQCQLILIKDKNQPRNYYYSWKKTWWNISQGEEENMKFKKMIPNNSFMLHVFNWIFHFYYLK